MPHPKVEAVAERARARLPATLERLGRYLTYPAISCDPSHAGDVEKLAHQIAQDLGGLGFQRARVLHLDDALPCVAAENLDAGPEKPTVLVYGHLDLQPVKGEPWDTDPHKLQTRGDRVYARGSADDMGGWVSHLAAVEAWQEIAGELPCNLKLLIEAEEEIGSPNLARYMDAHPDAFESHAMILTDCENPSTELPGLTVSLRGLMQVEVTCEALASDVHSGLWGNMVPDVSTALVKLLGRILDDDGRLNVGHVEVPEAWRSKAQSVPLDAHAIREGARILDGVDPLPERDRSAAEWLWRQPAVTILSTTLPTPDREKNALRTRASATLSVRLAPGQTDVELRKVLEDVLLPNPPGGVKVTLETKGHNAESWLYEPEGPAFPAADRAYEKAWGHKLLPIGVGGSIPFVALFGNRFRDLPLILNGVMDPMTGAHGPNESMHLGVFEKSIVANVYLYDELGALGELVR